MNTSLKTALGASLLAWLPGASAASVADLDVNNHQNWLLKSVCVNSSDAVLNVDPFGGCPTGASLRKIKASDPLPYANIDQINAQRADSILLFDKTGAPLYMHTFDFAPFGQYNLYNGSDGYDVYAIKNGWVSASNTRDGGGYETTFFGDNCEVGGGWLLFPTTGFLQPQVTWATSLIKGIYWEKSRQSFPGACSVNELVTTNTSYQKLDSFAFGSLNPDLTKQMMAIVVNHGYPGGVERFYFTREYGLTRWEAWNTTVPKQMPITCNGEAISTLFGPPGSSPESQVYYRHDCRDWSNTQAMTSAKQLAWPVANANLLQYGHFNAGFDDQGYGKGLWHRFYPAGGPVLNWAALVSETGGDNKIGDWTLPGTSYLATNCGATVCPTPGSQAIYQDTAIGSFCSACSYFYGVNARREASRGNLSIALQIIDNGSVKWQDVGAMTLAPDNGDPAYNEGASVVLSSALLSRVVTLPNFASLGLTANAYVRFLILPTTANNFDIVNAFVNPFPAMSGALVTP